MTKLATAQQKLDRAVAILDCARYRELGKSLRSFAAKNYPAGTVVKIARPGGYFLQGFSHFPEDACPNHQLPVTLENGNVWWYDLDAITAIPRSEWEPWVKREHRKRALRRARLYKVFCKAKAQRDILITK